MEEQVRPSVVLLATLATIATNVRAGTEYDFIDYNDNHIPVLLDTCKKRFMRKRNSQDYNVCPRGRELLELYFEANPPNILNGKTFGDILGKYAYFQYNGNSAVDYCFDSEDMTESVLNFHVYNHIHIYLTMLKFP